MSSRAPNGAAALNLNARILIMLGNEVPLWETMLAAIKLGAVVIPATTLLTWWTASSAARSSMW